MIFPNNYTIYTVIVFSLKKKKNNVRNTMNSPRPILYKALLPQILSRLINIQTTRINPDGFIRRNLTEDKLNMYVINIL